MMQQNQKPRYTFDSIPELKWQLLQDMLRDAPPSLEQVSPDEQSGGAIAFVALVVLTLLALVLWALVFMIR